MPSADGDKTFLVVYASCDDRDAIAKVYEPLAKRFDGGCPNEHQP